MPNNIKYAVDIAMELNNQTYVLTTQLKDQDGNNIGHERVINLPMDSMVVQGEYDNITKNIILTLNNGNTVVVPIGDLISGLQTEITPNNPLDVDLIDGLYNYSTIAIKNGNETIELKPNTNSDKLTIEAGENITLSASNNGTGLDNLRIIATDTTYNVATNSTDGLMSKEDKDKLDGIESNAEVNQNAFTTVNAAGTELVADSKTDTLSIKAGNNVSIVGNINDDSLTISATDTTYNVATNSTDGLMSKEDKDKLDGIESNAQKNKFSFKTIETDTNSVVADNEEDTLSIKGGTNISVVGTSASDTLTISTNAEVNQCAFSNVKVGTTTVGANSKTDTLEIVSGNNVSVVADSSNKKITINATDTTYNVATNSTDGLMSSSDKDKLDGIESNAQRNKNSFKTIVTNSGSVSAESEEDTLTFINGTNISISAAEDDKITVSTNAEVNQMAFSNMNVNGCVISASSKTDTLSLVNGNNVSITTNGKEIKIAANDTTYNAATQSADGLMSSTDKKKLDELLNYSKITVQNNGGYRYTLNPNSSDSTLHFLTNSDRITITPCETANNLVFSTTGEPNQDAFTSFNANGTVVSANDISDTLKVKAGNNIQITGNATDKSITVSTNADPNQNAFSMINTSDGRATATAPCSVVRFNAAGELAITASDSIVYFSTNAEVNQNAFSKVKVGTTTFDAASKTGTLTVVAGNNISVSPNSTGKSITINATYDVASNSNNGLMSSTDKTKLDNLKNFSTVEANGNNLVADNESGTLRIVPSGNITIIGDSGSDTLTISTNAEVNQNAFSTFRVGSLGSIVASSPSDTLTILASGYAQIGMSSNEIVGNYFYVGTSAEVNQNAYSRIVVKDSSSAIKQGVNSNSKTEVLNIIEGSNITITGNNSTKSLTISTEAEVNQNAFSTFNLVHQNGSLIDNVAADEKEDTLRLIEGNNISFSPNTVSDAISISACDQKVKQTPTTAQISIPVLLAGTATIDEATTNAYKAQGLRYIPGESALTLGQTFGDCSPSIVFSAVDSNSSTRLQADASIGPNSQITVQLPSHGGTLVTEGDVTDQLMGAGIEIDFAEKTYRKIGRTDYDNMACFGNRKLCILNRNMDGETVEILTDFNTNPYLQNTMVQQPKVYYKVVPITTGTSSQTGTTVVRKAQYWVSDKPVGGFKLHPAFTRMGGESSYVYHGAWPINYAASGPDGDPSNSQDDIASNGARAKYSTAGSCLEAVYGYQPRSCETRAWFRNGAKGYDNYFNSGASIETAASASLEQLLMLVEYGPNFQNNFATGWTNLTDDSSYNCSPRSGACFTNGNTSMAQGNTSLLSFPTTAETAVLVHGTSNNTRSYSYRGVQDFFGGIWEWIDGINVEYTENGIKVYVNHVNTSFVDDVGSSSSDYFDTGFLLPKQNGYINALAYNANYDWLLLPGEVGGTADSNLPIGDYFYQTSASSGFRCVLLGGGWGTGANAGPFCWDLHGGSSGWSRAVGARLFYTPES